MGIMNLCTTFANCGGPAVSAMSDAKARKKHAAPANPNRNERKTNPGTLCVYWQGNLCQANYVFSNEALEQMTLTFTNA